jgi:hypothetical protein
MRSGKQRGSVFMAVGERGPNKRLCDAMMSEIDHPGGPGWHES